MFPSSPIGPWSALKQTSGFNSARTEGIFTEPAGGVSVSVVKKMVDDGKIDKDETVVCYVTGNGLKATESIMEVLSKPEVMQADVAKISAVVK